MSALPLHMAVFDGSLAEVKRLVEAGTDVNARSSNQATPLHWAVQMEADSIKPDIISYLVEHGADVNATNSLGYTPLHFASLMGSVPATKRLLSLGADPTAEDSTNQTPVHRAKGKVKDFFKKELERKGDAKGLAMVSAMVKPRGEPIPYDLVREIGKNLDVKPTRFTPQSAKGRKTRARKTKRRLTRRRK